MGANLSLFNGEPGAGQLQSTVFGGSAVLDLPTDLEDPFISYEEDLTRYRAFEMSNESASKKVIRALERLRRDGTVSQSWAMENDSIMPPAFKRPAINSYSITPSKTNYSMACEMATWAIAGLALAGIAAVLALGWKFYHYITGTSSSSSGGGGGGGGESGDNGAAKAKAATVEASIKEREERTEMYSVISRELIEVIGKHSNKVKLTEAALGPEIYENLKSVNKSPDGVMMSLEVMTDLVKAAYKNQPESAEYEVLAGGAKNPAAYVFFLHPEQATILVTLVKETKLELAKISKEATEMIAKMSDFNSTSYHAGGKTELAGMIAQFRKWQPGSPVQNPIITHLEEIKRLTDKPSGNPKWTVTVTSLLKVVSERDDAFTTVFKDLQENLYIGDGNALMMLDNMLRAVEDFTKIMKARADEAVKVGQRPNTQEGADDTNRDTAAKEMSGISAFLKANLTSWQTLLKNAEQFCNSVKRLDNAIGNIIIKGLKLMDAVFKDNQVKLEAFDEMAEKISSKLGRKGVFKPTK